MDSFGGLAPVRDDFRCAVCQRKHAFHCEHDTPYRDQILGTYDRGQSQPRSSNSRRATQRTSTTTTTTTAAAASRHHHPENNSSVSYASKQSFTPANNFNLNADESYSQHRRQDNRYGSDTYRNSYGYLNTYPSKGREQPKKKSQCCVIS